MFYRSGGKLPPRGFSRSAAHRPRGYAAFMTILWR
jgi:hypothetical protein